MAGFDNDVVYGTNINLSVAGATGGNASLLTDGQMLIASTALNGGGSHVNVGTITSPLATISVGYSSPNITLDVVSSGIETIAGDTGSITGTNLTIYADNASNNSGSSVSFDNSGTVSTFNVTDVQNNTFIGKLCGNLNSAIRGGLNVAVGYNAMNAADDALSNVAVGYEAMLLNASSSSNVAIGIGALSSLDDGDGSNVAVGAGAAGNLIDGASNIIIGANAANTYASTESSNIIIGNPGVVTENNTIRIGVDGSGDGEQNICFIAGITGATPSSGDTPQVTLCDSNGNLTTISSSTAGFVLTSNGAATPSFQAASGAISPIFQAYLSANQANVTGDNTIYTIPFNQTSVNIGSAFNTGTGVFTAPATGTYLFTGTVYAVEGGAFAGMTQSNIILTATVANFNLYNVNPANTNGNSTLILPFSAIIPMTAGDTAQVDFFVGNATKTVLVGGLQGLSTFAGFKIA